MTKFDVDLKNIQTVFTVRSLRRYDSMLNVLDMVSQWKGEIIDQYP